MCILIIENLDSQGCLVLAVYLSAGLFFLSFSYIMGNEIWRELMLSKGSWERLVEFV